MLPFLVSCPSDGDDPNATVPVGKDRAPDFIMKPRNHNIPLLTFHYERCDEPSLIEPQVLGIDEVNAMLVLVARAFCRIKFKFHLIRLLS